MTQHTPLPNPTADVPLPPQPPLRLALFDLDYTLLPIDSDFEWGDFLVRQGKVDGATYRRLNDEYFSQYKAGTLDIREFLEFSLAPLARLERSVLDALHCEFMSTVIVPRLTPAARGLVEAHRAAGDLCAVVTATNAFVTGPITRALSIEHLIATVPEQIDGHFTGRVRGEPSFREGKVTRVEAWLESLGLHWSSFATVTFYSDSHNDLALLERVSDPVATNADAPLTALARQRGWRTLQLFNDQETNS